MVINQMPVSANPEFPIGLSLEYEYTIERRTSLEGPITIDQNKTFQYDVIEWAESVGSNIVKVNQTITDSDISDSAILYIHTRSWELYNPDGTLNGSYIKRPLWVDLSDWEDGTELSLPVTGPNSEVYDIKDWTDHNEVTKCGTFKCWGASWSSDSGTQSAHMRYEKQLGALVVQSQVYSVGAFYQRVTFNLSSNNFERFTSFSVPFEVLAISAVVIVIVIVVVVIKRK